MREVDLGRVLAADERRAWGEEQRAAGRTVAFTNGCFDLLHPGHVNYLEGAAAEADLLVVGVNADHTVRELKGEGRPVMNERDRARVVAALRFVDYVTVFAEPTADRLIELARPDVHCKGTDYGSPENVPEYEVVRSYGGKTALVGDPKDHSTRDFIGTVRDRFAK